ncbi:MAG: acyl-CoA desaturase [Phycisphaerae bacterium]
MALPNLSLQSSGAQIMEEKRPIETPENESVLAPASTAYRLGCLVVVITPFLGFLAAGYGLWGWGFYWTELVLLVAMFIATGLGITIGYHRLFTHCSFETVRPVKIVLGVLGSMAVEGPILRWVATHRKHHQHADKPDDPHSPHKVGERSFGVLAGLWHAHMGWLFKPSSAGLGRYVKDLTNDKTVRRLSQLFGVWVALGLLVPAVLGGLITGTWRGVLLGFLWGGLARVFLVHHTTWSINSICHLWGTRPFNRNDHSRNNMIFGILGFGEGWHNNHHAFPASAKFGLRWWEVDPGYYVICVMKWLGLAWHVRVPARSSVSDERGQLRTRYARFKRENSSTMRQEWQ